MNDIPAISSHLPDLIDSYISIRAQRLDLDRQVAEVKEQEDDLKKVIIAKFRETGLKALGATNGLVKMQETQEPKPNDWLQVWEWIRETGNFEILHKRIATLAVKERWEAGEVIPGIGEETVYKLTVSKK